MEVVADTNTCLAVALNEAETAKLVQQTRGHALLAPEVLPFEVGNALTAMLKKGTLDPDEIRSAWKAVQLIPVELKTIDISSSLAIAQRFDIYAYDAYFLECALSTRGPLLTLDRRLRAVAVEAGVEVLE